jgi:hypothetical protein
VGEVRQLELWREEGGLECGFGFFVDGGRG